MSIRIEGGFVRFQNPDEIFAAREKKQLGRVIPNSLSKPLEAPEEERESKHKPGPDPKSSKLKNRANPLTSGMQEYLKPILEGKSNREIAEIMGVKEGTVRIKRTYINGRLGIPKGTRTAAAIQIIQRKLQEPQQD